MTAEIKTRAQWVEACADHYLANSDIGPEMAREFAEACADSQKEAWGELSEWETPAAAADEDMSYWGD